jgi:UPF0271 protein
VRRIDLNADVGEGSSADDTLLAVVSSASIACGVHAGDATTMAATLAAAARHAVTVGAHPSYDDREGFGRRHVEVTPAALTAGLVVQIAALRDMAGEAGTAVTYVKPHGALYSRMATDAATAGAVLDALAEFGDLTLLAPAGSPALDAAVARGVPVAGEAFADRAYGTDGALVPRAMPGAVIGDPSEAARRAVLLATEGTVPAVDGSRLSLEARSICVHGDTPGAAAVAGAVRAALEAAGVTVEPFAG